MRATRSRPVLTDGEVTSNLISISESSRPLVGSHQPETVRAPEIEAGVGCDFDSYLLVPDNTLDDGA